MLRRETFEVGPLACNCTIVADDRSGDAIVVDGGDGVDEVVSRLRKNNWRAKLLVHTHAHIDHWGQAAPIRDRAGCELWMHPNHAHGTRAVEDNPKRGTRWLRIVAALAIL